MNPQQVPDTVLAAFLAAAARACNDPASAERLEQPLDAKYLRRDNGLYWLDVKRTWRIGATAMRILALAEANGSRFREWSSHPAGSSPPWNECARPAADSATADSAKFNSPPVGH